MLSTSRFALCNGYEVQRELQRRPWAQVFEVQSDGEHAMEVHRMAIRRGGNWWSDVLMPDPERCQKMPRDAKSKLSPHSEEVVVLLWILQVKSQFPNPLELTWPPHSDTLRRELGLCFSTFVATWCASFLASIVFVSSSCLSSLWILPLSFSLSLSLSLSPLVQASWSECHLGPKRACVGFCKSWLWTAWVHWTTRFVHAVFPSKDCPYIVLLGASDFQRSWSHEVQSWSSHSSHYAKAAT